MIVDEKNNQALLDSQIQNLKSKILNQEAIIGEYGVNQNKRE